MFSASLFVADVNMSVEECEPQRIKKLPDHVVNKIAAGEILQRPSSAVKELIENSIDAKASLVNVTLQDAGFKLLQIQDNGTGIQKEDLKIICERFTTSKLEQYSDLQTLSTHGFRGEALASICLVSSALTIVTKTEGSELAYRASYKEGKLAESVRPCAGNKGTQISIENLFFNMPLRRESLSNHNEEFNRITSLVTRYSLHYYWVTFSVHKQGENACNDFRTSGSANQKDKISDVFGSSLGKDVMDFEIEHCESLSFSCSGFVSRPCYVSKKYSFVLFVNNRLVEFPALKKSILNVYSVYLLKGNNPFVYLNLRVKGDEIDVNVHPTKEEVRMLHESEIVEKICKKVDQLLINSNSNQQFMVKTINPFLNSSLASNGTPSRVDKTGTLRESVGKNSPLGATESPCHMVRTDPTLQSLEPFFNKRKSSLMPSVETKVNDLDTTSNRSRDGSPRIDETRSFSTSSNPTNYPPRRTFKLNSLLNLRKEVEQNCDNSLREIISNCSYVGSSSPEIAFVQHSTELWLLNMQNLAEQLFYQIIIYDFGNFGRFSFSSQNLYVQKLVELALRKSKKYEEEFGGNTAWVAAAVEDITQKFYSRSSMLLDYFSWEISPETGQLATFPMLLRNYEPSFEILPELIAEMGLKACWNKEQECFDSFARIIAKYYTVTSRFWMHRPDKDWKYMHEHVLLPAMKLFLQPSKNFQQCVAQVASLPQLYKIFERC